MKSYKWANLFHHHPIFSELKDDEVRRLLENEASQEHEYDSGSSIMHAGEVGDSVFVIGSGSLGAVIPLDGGNQIKLSMMRKGEIFGEMALFDNRPRSATVIAREASTVLEIGGREFREMLERHPGMEVKMLLAVSERLRNAGEELMKLHLHGIDDKLQFFNAKLDVEHRIVDTSLKAAQTVFDQTRQRADEVISSFERSRSLIQTMAAVIGTVITIVVSGLGYLGWSSITNFEGDMKAKVEAVETLVVDAENKVAEVGAKIAKVDAAVETAKAAQTRFVLIERQMKIARKALGDSLLVSFYQEVENGQVVSAVATYNQAQQLRGYEKLNETFFTRDVPRKIAASSITVKDLPQWNTLFETMLDPPLNDDGQLRLAWYLKLANYVLTKDEGEFNKAFTEFQAVIKKQKDNDEKRGGADEATWKELRTYIENKDSTKEKLKLFDKVVNVAKKLPEQE